MPKDNYCEVCKDTFHPNLLTCPVCASKSWTEQEFECVSIGPEPPLNTEGFWPKFEKEEIKIEHPD